jgi:phosphonopyruvate decarboxylase
MSIKPIEFYDYLVKHGVEFFTGVPDSLLKHFCLCIDDNIPKEKHIIAANEGNAIALATGYHLATGKLPMVYMQNSGLGNSVNPLLSLCDPDVYSIPMLLLIGWRGEPSVQDEPQHVKQGAIQIEFLKTMGIPYKIISKDTHDFKSKISNCLGQAKNENRPTALLIKKGTFQKYGKEINKSDDQRMKREEALEIVLEILDDNAIVVSTTGKTSREIFEIRKKKGQTHEKDFLTVGSMGHCSSIALGIAIAKPERKIICIDGDGALIMHMGSLSTVGKLFPKNFYHILINNQVHESVGGQATSAKYVDISDMVKANGYRNVFFTYNQVELISQVGGFIKGAGPNFLEVLVKPGSRDDLGRPTVKLLDNKRIFMDFVQEK